METFSSITKFYNNTIKLKKFIKSFKISITKFLKLG